MDLGRSDEAALCIDHSGVSRRHAELHQQGPILVIRDLGSTNGTWLDGRRVERAAVSPGSVLRIGDCVGVFELREPGDVGFGEIAPGLFGGAELARMFGPARQAAGTKVPVVIVGESGVGKERVARAIHAISGRQGPFFAVNCAALPETLAESELFGHRRGAFTGADKAGAGYFRAADGGTLFLDEIPELSPAVQAKLLRVIEDGQVLALGEVTPTAVDVRILTATQHSLAQLVATKTLRRDLAARLNGLELRVPSLAARRSDVALLFEWFLHEQTGCHPPPVDARLIEALLLHRWPENVRELQLLTRTLLAVHGNQPMLRRQHLPPHIASSVEAQPLSSAPEPLAANREDELARVERELKGNGNNVRAAATALGISRQRIYRLLAGRAWRVGAAPSHIEVESDVAGDE
jgi:transcriptional regulator with PAS, ATPase and Fis domain